MAATTKLIVYNEALRLIGSHRLADLVTTNSRLTELDGAYDHAVEHALARLDWGFARRRASLTGVSDTSFAPYTYRFTKPSDYLRKCWLKVAAPDESQVEHAEIAAVFYAFESSALLEYISDHADNYDPANWPPHFTRMVSLKLAALVANKLARGSDNVTASLQAAADRAYQDAVAFESVFLVNEQLDTDRLPVFRRGLEIIGQELAGTVAIYDQADRLRWAMNRSWAHAVDYVLSRGAWNFAAKRARYSSGADADSTIPSTDDGGIVEGYAYGTATDADSSLPSISGYDYAWALPDDFVHKIWFKATPASDYEPPHQIIGEYIMSSTPSAVMEYVANNVDTSNPTKWPSMFLEAVAAYLALCVVPAIVVDAGANGRARIKSNELKGPLQEKWMQALTEAKNSDAVQQYAFDIPRGRWARARGGMTRAWNAS